MSFRTSTASFTVALLIASWTVSAHAQVSPCTPLTPTGAPITISAPGVYCLAADVVMPAGFSGTAITINADNVVLDLKERSVLGSSDPATAGGLGIYAYGKKNIVVRRGMVKGFAIGISLYSGSAPSAGIVEDMRIVQNRVVGLQLNGNGGIARRNIVDSTGLGAACGNGTLGIFVAANGALALNNVVSNHYPGCFGDAVNVSGNGVIVEQNQVTAPTLNPGQTRGIMISGNDVVVVDNRMSNLWRGISFQGTNGVYRDNVTANVQNPYWGGTNLGNNF